MARLWEKTVPLQRLREWLLRKRSYGRYFHESETERSENANGDPLFKSDMQSGTNYFLDGSPMNFLNNGSFDKSKALMISGDFSQLAYSIRQDITFKLFTEGVVQNSDGSIAYNLMQNDMVALRAVMRLGWEIPNPINSVEKDKTKRCPFSILKAGA